MTVKRASLMNFSEASRVPAVDKS